MYCSFYTLKQPASQRENKQSQKPNQNSSVGDKYNVLIYCPDQNSRRNGSCDIFVGWLVLTCFLSASVIHTTLYYSRNNAASINTLFSLSLSSLSIVSLSFLSFFLSGWILDCIERKRDERKDVVGGRIVVYTVCHACSIYVLHKCWYRGGRNGRLISIYTGWVSQTTTPSSMFVLFVLPHIYKRMAIDSRRTNISNELYPPFGKHFLLNRSVGRSVGWF